MGIISFGNRKPSKSLVKMARRHGVKVSIRRGGRRLYKSAAVIKRQIKKKQVRGRHVTRRRVIRRRVNGHKYRNVLTGCGGLKKKVCQSNPNCTYTRRGCRGRKGTVEKGLVYEGPMLPSEFGNRKTRFGDSTSVCRQFFNDCVPTMVSPEWNAMIQPDGSYIQVGAPFYYSDKKNNTGLTGGMSYGNSYKTRRGKRHRV